MIICDVCRGPVDKDERDNHARVGISMGRGDCNGSDTTEYEDLDVCDVCQAVTYARLKNSLERHDLAHGERVGYLDPESKRFIYVDQKRSSVSDYSSYTIPVVVALPEET